MNVEPKLGLKNLQKLAKKGISFDKNALDFETMYDNLGYTCCVAVSLFH